MFVRPGKGDLALGPDRLPKRFCAETEQVRGAPFATSSLNRPSDFPQTRLKPPKTVGCWQQEDQIVACRETPICASFCFNLLLRTAKVSGTYGKSVGAWGPFRGINDWGL